MKEITCPICGKRFEGYHTKKYCGKECSAEAARRKERLRYQKKSFSEMIVYECFDCPFDDCLFGCPDKCPAVNGRELTRSEQYHLRKARLFKLLEKLNRGVG